MSLPLLVTALGEPVGASLLPCAILTEVESQAYWDGQAEAFDREPDHGLADPAVRRAWRDLLLEHLPSPADGAASTPSPVEVVDLGCGTGSLSVLLAEAGYVVRGIDLSTEMVKLAAEKARMAGVEVAFEQGDAARPPYSDGCCDVVLARHVLWALPDPDAALARWVRLLRPAGRLVLVEGRWSTGAGLTAQDCEALVRRYRSSVVVRRLDEAEYWGGPIQDERYLLVSVE